MTYSRVIQALLAALLVFLATQLDLARCLDHHGNEFFTAFPKNDKYPSLSTPRLHITTAESQPVSFNITTGNVNYQYSGTVTPGQTATLTIHYALTVTSNTDLNKAIHIKAEGNKKIAVYASNYVIGSAGAFAVLPLHHYDIPIPEYIYYAVSSDTSASGEQSTVLLVSGYNDTVISITPTQVVILPPAITDQSNNIQVESGQTYHFTLHAMQTFMIESNHDLSGSKIVSSKPLSVISGHQCGNVPKSKGYCDHMAQQIPPIITWGTKYMSLPLAKRTSGSFYKILAAETNTTVNITCGNMTIAGNNSIADIVVYSNSLELGSGEYANHITAANKWCSFVSDKGILVTQFSEGGQDEGLGDPMSMTLTPVEQFTSVTNVIVPSSPFESSTGETIENLLHIFMLADIEHVNVTIDNESLPPSKWIPIYNDDKLIGHALSKADLSSNAHIITTSHSTPLTALSYGFTSDHDAFGYPVNGALDPINYPLLVGFQHSNYNVTEGNEYFIPVHRQTRLDNQINLDIQGCNGELPAYIIADETVTFSPGVQSQSVRLNILDNNELEKRRCFCIELVPSHNGSYTYLLPYSRATVCINDNEDVRLKVSHAKIDEKDDGSRELELMFSLLGYKGEADVKISVQPMIQQSTKRSSSTQLPILNVFFTKYLTTAIFAIPLKDNAVIYPNSYITFTTSTNSLNINSTSNPMQVILPTEIAPTSSSSPASTETPSPVAVNTPSPSPQSSSPSSQSHTSLALLPSLLPTTAGISFLKTLPHLIVYISIVILAISLVVTCIVCCVLVKVYERKRHKVDLPPLQAAKLNKSGQSTVSLISHRHDSSDDIHIGSSNSLSPPNVYYSPRTSSGSNYSDTVSTSSPSVYEKVDYRLETLKQNQSPSSSCRGSFDPLCEP